MTESSIDKRHRFEYTNIVAPDERRLGEPAGAPFLFSETSIKEEVSMKEFLLDDRGDMVERGLLMAAIVVAAVALWITIGQKLATRLGIVNSAIGG